MRRGLAIALVVGGIVLAGGLVALLPAVLGHTSYSPLPRCVPEFPDATPDEVFQLPLVAGEEVRVARPEGPHTLQLQTDGARISRAGDERASFGYQAHGCGGGDEVVVAHGDGTLQISVWRYSE